MTECELRYIMGCLRYLLEQGAGSMEPRQVVHDEFNARIDAENLRSVWGVATVNSWYRNKHGVRLRIGRSVCWTSGPPPANPIRTISW